MILPFATHPAPKPLPHPRITALDRQIGCDSVVAPSGRRISFPTRPLSVLLHQVSLGCTSSALGDIEWSRVCYAVTRQRPADHPDQVQVAKHGGRLLEQIWEKMQRNPQLFQRFADAMLVRDDETSPLRRHLAASGFPRSRQAATLLHVLGERWTDLARELMQAGEGFERFSRQGVWIGRRSRDEVCLAAANMCEPKHDDWLADRFPDTGRRSADHRTRMLIALFRSQSSLQPADFPRTAAKIRRHFQAGSVAWKELPDALQTFVRHWSKSLTFAAVQMAVDAVSRNLETLRANLLKVAITPSRDQVETSKQSGKIRNERNRLTGRTDFWSHYKSDMVQMRLILTNASRQVIERNLTTLPTRDLIAYTTKGQNQTEVLVIDFGSCVVVDELRGRGDEARWAVSSAESERAALLTVERIPSRKSLISTKIARGSNNRPARSPNGRLLPASGQAGPKHSWEFVGDHGTNWEYDLRDALAAFGVHATPVNGGIWVTSVSRGKKRLIPVSGNG